MKKISTLSLLLLLAACSSTPDSPSAQAIGKWKAVGQIHQNNIALSYDTGSLKKQGNLASLRERKIVSNTNQENYLNLPEFKTAISEWEFHCTNRTYRLKSSEFWDKNGKPIIKHTYTSSQVPAMKIATQTPTESQFNIACK